MITALPTPPARSMSSDAFVAAADSFLGALPTFGTEANALATDVNAKVSTATTILTTVTSEADAAAASATAAAASAASALAGAGASSWVSGSYTTGAVVWSPTDFKTYRAITTGAKTIDPANDPTNWVMIVPDVSLSVNPRSLSQAVMLTDEAVASMSVADSANLDVGTSNFSWFATTNLVDWTPAVTTFIFYKGNATTAHASLRVNSSGGISLALSNGATITAYSSTIINGFKTGSIHSIGVTVTRETATADGSVSLYVDGSLFGAPVALPAGAPNNQDNANPLYLLGSSTIKNNGILLRAVQYNYALSAAQQELLYLNGVASEDTWGNNTVKNISSCANSGALPYDTFSGASATGFSAAKTTIVAGQQAGTADEIVMTYSKKILVEFDLVLNSGSLPDILPTTAVDGTSLSTQVLAIAGHNSIVFTITGASTTGTIRFHSAPSALTNYVVSNLRVVDAGAVLDLEPEGIQLDEWYDRSINNLNVTYPATGFRFAKEITDAHRIDTPVALTGSATLTIAQLLKRILRDTHATGATATYVLPTGALMLAALPSFPINKAFEWTLINLSAAAADTVTISAGTDHTVSGNMVIQSAHATTGALYGSSGRFATRRVSATAFETYRVG